MAAALALIYFILIGGTEAGELSPFLRAVNAVIAGAVLLIWMSRVWRREADAIDALATFAVFAFALSGVFSTFPRASLEASTSALAMAAAFLTARSLVSTGQGRRIALYTLAVAALFLSVAFAVLWGLIWVRWISLTGHLPPLDLWLPVGAFRNWYFVTLLVAVLFPALLWLVRQSRWTLPAALGIIASLAVILMSGSRTAWLAFGLGVAVTALARGLRPGRRTAMLMAATGAVVLLAFTAGLLDGLLARIGTTSTVTLRLAIWEASLDGWLGRPLVGTGPGSFGAGITMSGFFGENSSLGAHADSAPIQLLSEVGLLGILAAVLLGAALVIGQRRANSPGWHAYMGLAIFLLSCLTNNPTTIANITLVAIVWAALITPRVTLPVPSVRALPKQWRWTRKSATALGLAGVLAAATTSTLVAAFAYDRATGPARAGDSDAVMSHLRLATALDPGHPLPHRDLGIWLLAAGDLVSAEKELRQATSLNPADTTALRSLALVLADSGRGEEAKAFAQRAFQLRPLHEENGLTLAYIAATSNPASSDDHRAVVDAVARLPWLPADPSWDGWLPTGRDLEDLQRAVEAGNAGGTILADAWSDAAVGEPADVPQQSSAGAITAVIDCRFSDAQEAVDAVRDEWRDTEVLISRILVAQATGGQMQDLLLLTRYRWGHLAALAAAAPEDGSPFGDPAEDERQYRRTSIGPPPDLGPVFPTADGGLSAWLRDPATAADRSAPLSGLASCR